MITTQEISPIGISSYGTHMPVSPIDPHSVSPVSRQDKTAGSFEDVFAAAMSLVNETNQLQKVADTAQVDFAAGRTDNVLEVMMAEQKAYSSLEFTVQVTNKVIEAYREIMRLQA